MLDIHPPHHAASTWRDFFVHIAAIVIGLLSSLKRSPSPRTCRVPHSCGLIA
jgi:hypothetical protein